MGAVIRMGGFELDKAKTPCRTLDVLGASISPHRDYISAKLPVSKRDDLINSIDAILKCVILSPRQAAKMRGRLCFTQTLMYGKFRRGAVTALSKPPIFQSGARQENAHRGNPGSRSAVDQCASYGAGTPYVGARPAPGSHLC